MSKRYLRTKTPREQTEEMIETLKATLEQAPELFKKDFEQYVVEYELSLIEHEFADKTISKYVRNAKWFIENYTSNDRPLNKDDVLEFKSDLQTNYDKVQTINSYITTINRFLFYCEQGAFKVEKVKGQSNNVLPHRIYRHEYVRMYNKAKAIGNMQLHFIIKVMGSTGVRVDELKSFTSKSIQKTSIEVNNKGKTRTVPVPGPLIRELRQYVKENKIDGPVFRLTYDEIYHGLKNIAGMCRVKKPKVHPHAFRHYFGFRFVKQTGDLKIAQLADILGHNSVETTRIYTRGTIEDYKKTMEGM